MPSSTASATIVITGASGFVGGHLITALLESNDPGNLIDAGVMPAPGVAHMPLNIADFAAIRALVRDLKPRAIIHLAAMANPRAASENPDACWAMNFEAVRVMGETIRTDSPQTRLIFPSSSEAYGASFTNAPAPLAEDAPLKPRHVYAAAKAAADIALGQLAYDGLDVVRFRPFNHVGPGQIGTYALPTFAEGIARIEAGLQAPVLEVGDLNAERDFLDVRDVVRGYAAALTLPPGANPEHVFNLASGAPRKLGAALDTLLSLSTNKIDVKIDAARLRANDINRTWGDATRAAKVLGWRPQIAFDQTLADILTDWRARVKS